MSSLEYVTELLWKCCYSISCHQVNGVEKIHPIGPISAEEQKLLDACFPELKKNIEKGKAFIL